MLIKKKMERLVNIGNYENIKIGVTLEKEIEGKDIESIKKAGLILGKLADSIINAEVIECEKKYKKGEN